VSTTPFGRVTGLFRTASAVLLGAMMLLTCADVVGRFLGHPILGAVELGVLMAALVLAFSLPYTQREKGHVGVELLYMRLGPRWQTALDLITSATGSALFGMICWQTWRYAGQMKASGEVSMTLQLPTYTIIYLIAASFGMLAAVQGVEVVAALRRGAAR
jgi:TRAP-type C4-dicarboxylate transport system permease small subunit